MSQHFKDHFPSSVVLLTSLLLPPGPSILDVISVLSLYSARISPVYSGTNCKGILGTPLPTSPPCCFQLLKKNPY